MTTRIIQVDAFTDTPYRGNPAAVCVLDDAGDETWMQNVAREMNLSETAFLFPQDGGFNLRWFTPTVEVALCGHATLASAHVLWEDGRVPVDAVARFHTKSGLLTAVRKSERIEMDFPALIALPVARPDGLAAALGVPLRCVSKNKFDYVVELESEQVVRDLQPDMAALKKLDARAISVTCGSESPAFDFVSRVFGPRVGVDEDPVTGSAHCSLGPYWSKRLGKTEMVAFQASARGGTVRVRLDGDRVILGGQAVTVLRGELLY
jgi:PhzF family phenazine biosynthesis protein